MIEKHFTLSRDDGGVASTLSLEPHELLSLVVETKRAWQSLGNVTYGAGADEIKSNAFRRSLYIAEDVQKGDVFTEQNVRIIRPGFVLPSKRASLFIGRTASRDIPKGTPVSWDLL